MKKSVFFKSLLLPAFLISSFYAISQAKVEPMASGKYQPTWESLRQYSEAPDWYQNAKFGIWAHWGPQCQPGDGDWYARFMYFSGTSQYNFHVSKYGSPATFGFKDVINTWKAQNWNPDSLVHLYKNAGAQYFFAMANHHDNFDMYDSKYQPWNSVAVGPKKDIIGGWAQAARKYGLPFGVSIHASHAWTWLEPSQDWDGNLTAADGAGKWWEGLNPQDLYAQRHPRSTGSTNSGTIHSQWDWGNGASLPDTAYLNKYYNRTIDLINKYNPDLLYFDDTALPFSQISDVGLRIAAHMYNKSIANNGGVNKAVIFGKILTEEQKEAIVWDVERGIPDRPQKKYWQTCSCIGDWHYNINVYNNNGYKSAQTVIRMLIDIVSKNGNLLLNVPVRGDGTIDEKELAVVQGITAWMNVNKESIPYTRPWITFGEGPTADAVNPLSAQGFNEGISYTSKDVRYVCRKDTVFASIMGWPEKSQITLKALGTASSQYLGKINKVKLLGYGDLTFTRDFNGLNVKFPTTAIPTGSVASVLKIQFDSTLYSYNNLNDLIVQCQLAVDSANLHIGLNTGQYIADSINSFAASIQAAKTIPSSATADQIRAGILTLQSGFYLFRTNALVKGGILSYPMTQNITRDVLGESRNFSRTDAGSLGTGRWGLLGSPWMVTNNLLNQENFTRGGFDNYSSSKSIGIQKWNASDPAITNGMIYQTTTLPAGTYKLKIKVHENWGMLSGEDYLNVSRGTVLPNTAEVPSKSIAYYDMSGTSSGGQYTVCPFKLDSLTEVSIGWSTSIASSATSRSMRVNEILLLDGNGNDISATYLKNYTNIQRKDMSYTRFGVPKNWTVENFNIPQGNSDGTKKGIDRYPGYKTLMMGVWDDAYKASGNLKDAKIYRQIALPAGRYAFTAGYNTVDKLSEMYLFASTTVPTLTNLKSTALSYYSIIGDTNDGTKYGLEFTLTQPTTLYVGWIGNLSEVAEQEFRVKELSLVRVLNSEADYLSDKAFNASEPGTYKLNMSTFDNLSNLTWSSSLDDVNYIIGASDGVIEVGDIDFGLNKTQNITIESASNSTVIGQQCYYLFKDSESSPFAIVSAKNTGGMLYFESLKTPDLHLNGIHKISIKYVNHQSYVNAVGISSKLANSLNAPTTNHSKYNVTSQNKSISIYGLDGETMIVYDMNGKKVIEETSVKGNRTIPLKNGIYLVKIGDQTYKTVIK
ncbi:MAG: alpha-L-fucosidase [Bacteroidota bacterium]|nr:alpha-L-fucosidase [Bacteroidota bacterium]